MDISDFASFDPDEQSGPRILGRSDALRSYGEVAASLYGYLVKAAAPHVQCNLQDLFYDAFTLNGLVREWERSEPLRFVYTYGPGGVNVAAPEVEGLPLRERAYLVVLSDVDGVVSFDMEPFDQDHWEILRIELGLVG